MLLASSKRANDPDNTAETVRVRCLLFFFSSRRRHTRLQGDWSSDVCSSDLLSYIAVRTDQGYNLLLSVWSAVHSKSHANSARFQNTWYAGGHLPQPAFDGNSRSEERRVGKECRSRWSPYH